MLIVLREQLQDLKIKIESSSSKKSFLNILIIIFRKNQARALDSMQASLEAETRAKTEALTIKKKIETEINELEIALDQPNKANAEAHKTIKRYQYRDVETSYEEECRQRQEIVDRADRRANALQVIKSVNIKMPQQKPRSIDIKSLVKYCLLS